MKKSFWQIIKKYKLFIILGMIILLFSYLKLNSKKEIKTNTSDGFVIKNEITVGPTKIIDQTDKKEMSQEEISNLGYTEYFEYLETLTIEEQKKAPPLAMMINELFPYEGETFLAEKFKDLKVYAKLKSDDKTKAERDLKHWFYLEIGETLPSEKIVWQ